MTQETTTNTRHARRDRNFKLSPDGRWKTFVGVKNRRQLVPTDEFYVWAKVRGTQCCERTGKYKLRDAELCRDERLSVMRKNPLQLRVNKDLSFGDTIESWKLNLQANVPNEKTRQKQLSLLASLLASWPLVPAFKANGWSRLEDLKPKNVTGDDLKHWRIAYEGCGPIHGKHGADYTNRTVAVLRDLFEIARKHGAFHAENPTRELKRLRVLKKPLALPTQEQFDRFLQFLQNGHRNQPKKVAQHVRDYVEGLVFTGLRKNEAAQVTKELVDLRKWQIALPAALVKGQKIDRVIPIIEEARPLFQRLVKDRLQYRHMSRRRILCHQQ